MIERLESRVLLATDIRINAGGGSYTDSTGHVWQADKDFFGGAAVTSTFAPQQTSDPGLMVTSREGPSFRYDIPLPKGYYTVTVLEAEPTFTKPQQRIFSVYALNHDMINNWDLVSSVGSGVATEQSFQIAVNSGTLELRFVARINESIVSAIHIFSSPPPPQLPDAPSRFAASWNLAGKIELNWESIPESGTGYLIQRSTDGGPYKTILDGSNPLTSDTWDSGYVDTTVHRDHQYSYRLSRTNGKQTSASLVVKLATIRPTGPTPFSGKPVTLPATIQAENFDSGGDGISYQDNDVEDNGQVSAAPWNGHYRTTPVDMQPVWGTTGNYAISWAQGGEWLDYTIRIPTAGVFDLTTRYSNPDPDGMIHYELDGTPVTPEISLPSTGSFDTYASVTTRGITLPKGYHVLRLVMDNGTADENFVGDFDWFKLQPTNTPPAASAKPMATSLTPAGTSLFNTDIQSGANPDEIQI